MSVKTVIFLVLLSSRTACPISKAFNESLCSELFLDLAIFVTNFQVSTRYFSRLIYEGIVRGKGVKIGYWNDIVRFIMC